MYDYAPAPEPVWTSLTAVFVIQFIVFVIGTLIKDYSIADITEGFVIAIPNAIILSVNGNIHTRTLMILCMIWAWTLRIAVTKSIMHKGENRKYAVIRQALHDIGGYNLVLLGGFGIFVYQGCVLFVIGNVVNMNQLYSDEEDELFVLGYFGLAVYVIGIGLQIVADLQLYLFKKKLKNADKIYKGGLWRFSRHPNYLGEILVWFGMYFVVAENPLGYILIWSPLTVLLLLRFAIGVPLVEKKYEHNNEYQTYMRETNCLFPWAPKKPKVMSITPIQDDSTRILK